MPSVKFAPSVDEQKSQKRPRKAALKIAPDDDDVDGEATTQKQKRHRPNEDEIDDIDDWKGDEDPDDDQVVPSEKELLEAKRKRRQNRAGLAADGRTSIDEKTSLATEGIAIEPFHMKNEESDGAGFFDGDTYVFRKHNVEEGEDEEPDAWLDRLRDDAAEGKVSQYTVPDASEGLQESRRNSMDNFSKEELYQRILPLLNDQESVSQALIRYGKLIKQPRTAKGKFEATSITKQQSTAKHFLDDLTGAANALLLKGEVEIYQSTKVQIQRHLPSTRHLPQLKKSLLERQPPAQWEYKGNLDGAIHGPYETTQMIDWTKAGYFVGAQRVQIRTLREEVKDVSTADDLLNDLMDDNDDNDDANAITRQQVKGEWQWSNEVDFDAYLPI